MPESASLVSSSFTFCVFQETRTLAEIAKAELDGTVLNNRPIRVSFATHTAALTVRNLLPAVTNELLEEVCFKNLSDSTGSGCLSNLLPVSRCSVEFAYFVCNDM